MYIKGSPPEWCISTVFYFFLIFFFCIPQLYLGVAESMEITRERMRVCQQNRALMELSFVDICIFQAISLTEVYGRS